MSTTVDNRVIEMQFDNKQFENNVRTSMSTLEKLKQSLNLSGASKGLENVSAAAKNNNMNVLGNAVETVQAKFSALQVMGVTALANITNAAVNAGTRIAKSLTIDPIMDGFREYETQMNSVQTILANTQSKGSTLTDVTAALDELNAYADKTIYNFTEMTRNIGTFTAAGVDLDTSVSAIQGIANLAAISGSTSQQASTAMYQLSQALAAGTVKLMDWNSVVNAGMGGEVFQTALRKTSEELNTGAEAAIKAKGSFRESLQTGWLTAEVLTETLKKFTTSGANEYVAEYTGLSTEAVQAALDSAKAQYGEADAIDKAAEALAEKSGKNKEEIKEALELARTAEDAATKVKTFSQLMDTLKEAVGSGWAKTWQIIFGDFEEAKELFTSISDVASDFINKMSDSRNSMLQEWKDMGGRTALIESLTNIFKGLASVIKPIAEAFREVFEPLKGETLANACKSFQEFTSHLKLSDENAAKLKSTFKGVFSVIETVMKIIGSIGKGAFDIIVSIVSALTGFSGGVLDITAAIGDWLSGISDAINETNTFGNTIEKVTGFITGIVDGIKEFAKSLFDTSTYMSAFGSLIDFFKTLLDVVTQVGAAIGEAFSSIGSGISEGFSAGGFFELLNGGIFAGILLSIKKFIGGFADSFDDVFDGIGNITGILDEVKGCFEAYQNDLNASALIKIAGAIAILAASLLVLSTINAEDMDRALAAITVLFIEMMAAMAAFSKIDFAMFGVAKSVIAMIALSSAILILSAALKNISSVDWPGLAKGLIGVGVLMAEIALFLEFAKFDGKVFSTALGIVLLASALLILSKAVEKFGSMEWGSIGKGLVAIGALLLEIAAFTKLTSNASNLVSTGVGIVLIAAAMKTLASAMQSFGSMDLASIGRGLLAMGGALAEIAIAMAVIPKNLVSSGVGLAIIAASMIVLAKAFSSFSTQSWDEIARGLVAMGGSLGILAAGLHLMNGTLAGSAALIIAAGALAIMTPVMLALGGMSWTSIAKGLIALAGGFAVIGIAGTLLGPLIPTLLGLAAAIGVFGIAVFAIGAGLALAGVGLSAIAVGITALGTSIAAAATSIVAGLTIIITGLLDLVPTIAEKLAEGFVAFAQLIGEAAPTLADALLKLISEVLASLANYAPQIVDSLLQFLIGVIDSLAENIPTLITSVMNFIGKLFDAIIQAFSQVDPAALLQGVVALGIFTGIVYALGAIGPMIPGAMVGVIGLGIIAAEIAAVIAAFGALAQIPGLQWLIGEGGNLLQSIGTAIGQFVGGLVGGIGQGITSSLPAMAQDLSSFMDDIQPFIDGAKNIDESMLSGVKTLAETILILTAADILNGLTSFITGGNSLSNFAEQLKPFGEGMKEYSDSVAGIDTKAITASAAAAKALASVGDAIPAEGGIWQLLAGEHNLGSFGEKLVPFGEGMKKYAAAVAGIDPTVITASATAAKSLAELGDAIPADGGIWQLIAGKHDLASFGEKLVPFGAGMKAYGLAVMGVDSGSIVQSAAAAKALVEVVNALPTEGGFWSLIEGDKDLSKFGEKLAPFGQAMKMYAVSVMGIDTNSIVNSADAAKALVSVAEAIPSEGGLWDLFAGEKDLAKFGEKLVPFGTAMKMFGISVMGINTEAIIASAEAAKAIVSVAEAIPSEGGLWDLFAGDKDLAKFGEKLPPFGLAMRMYAASVAGIDTAAITASVSAAMAIVSVAEAIPSEGGLWDLFAGEKDLAKFGQKLVPFGLAMRMYAASVAGIDTAAITMSAAAAQAIVRVAESIPPEGGLWQLFEGNKDLAKFSEKLVPFGMAMRQYAISVAGIDVASIVMSASAAQAMVSVANAVPSDGGLWSLFEGEKDLSKFGEKLIPFGMAMRSYSVAVAGVNNGAIVTSVSGARGMVSVANAVSDDVKITMSASEFSTLGAKLTTFGMAMRQYATSVAGINFGSINSSVSGAKAIVSLINSTAGLNTSGVGPFVQAINTLGTAQVDKLVAAFQNASGKMISAGFSLMQSLANGLRTGQSSVNSAVQAVVNFMHTAFTSKSAVFMSTGLLLMRSLTSGITVGRALVLSAVISVVTSAASGANVAKSIFYAAGYSCAQGFANGIASGSFLASVRARAMANAAAKAAKNAIDSHSPSKVFKKIGEYVPQGFAIGISSYSNLVEKSSEKMANKAVDTTSSAVARVAEAFNLVDSDSQPTIRPVVDLSNVESGASAINGLFNNDFAIGTKMNLNAISASMSRRNQNGVNDDVVSAIDKLRKDVGNLESRSYSIGGITYSTGDEVSNAIETLVRAVRVEGRV